MRRKSQSPSLRGSGRFGKVFVKHTGIPSGLNPLHCGAVVASSNRRSPCSRLVSLNPLHCGAVVASPAAWRRGKGG